MTSEVLLLLFLPALVPMLNSDNILEQIFFACVVSRTWDNLTRTIMD